MVALQAELARCCSHGSCPRCPCCVGPCCRLAFGVGVEGLAAVEVGVGVELLVVVVVVVVVVEAVGGQEAAVGVRPAALGTESRVPVARAAAQCS